MADEETLLASYHAALAGCPPPARVAACVSGTRHAAGGITSQTLTATTARIIAAESPDAGAGGSSAHRGRDEGLSTRRLPTAGVEPAGAGVGRRIARIA